MTMYNCAKCNTKPRLTTGKEIYPHREDLHGKNFYKCDSCGGYVGCHGYTSKPLGSPADAELRRARGIIHSIIDPIWQKERSKSARRNVYKFMSKMMGIDKKYTHIGMFDINRCRDAYKLMKNTSYSHIMDNILDNQR